MQSRTRVVAYRISPLVAVIAAIACGRSGPPQVGGEPIEAPDGRLAVAYDAGTHEIVLELGPVDLPAHSDHHAVQQPKPLEGVITVNGWVNGYSIEIVDKNGQQVPHDVLHHVNIIVPGRRELFSQIMQRLGAAGHETAPVKAPGIVGYPLGKGDRILLTAMVHNPTDQSYEGVRIRVRMPHIDRERLVRPIRVYPFYIDVMPPAGIHEFDLPPGHFEKSWEGRPAVSGRILGVGGHVHRYATSLRFEDVTEGKVLYQTVPELDAEGNVVGMPQDLLIWKLGIKIDASHTYKLAVEYENPTGDTIPGGGMGALGGIMLASGEQEWPTIDPRNEEYQRDIAVTMREHDMGDMMMGGPGGGHTDDPSMPAHSH